MLKVSNENVYLENNKGYDEKEYYGMRYYKTQESSKGKYLSLTYRLILAYDGKGGIPFDISQFSTVTILVHNLSEYDASGLISISPDGVHYYFDPNALAQTIPKQDLGVYPTLTFAQYVRINITGAPFAEFEIYLQAQRI